MKAVTMLEFRQDAERVLSKVRKGERFVLTHRGKPVARLEPIHAELHDQDDPFYSVCELSERSGSLANRQIDEIVYGK